MIKMLSKNEFEYENNKYSFACNDEAQDGKYTAWIWDQSSDINLVVKEESTKSKYQAIDKAKRTFVNKMNA